MALVGSTLTISHRVSTCETVSRRRYFAHDNGEIVTMTDDWPTMVDQLKWLYDGVVPRWMKERWPELYGGLDDEDS